MNYAERHNRDVAQLDSADEEETKCLVRGEVALRFSYNIISLTIKYYSYRDVAQLGSALRLGRRGRTFESCHPDHLKELVLHKFFFIY